MPFVQPGDHDSKGSSSFRRSDFLADGELRRVEIQSSRVSGFLLCRPTKLRLKLDTTVFRSRPLTSTSVRCHCPTHGPHVLLSTTAPASRNASHCLLQHSSNMKEDAKGLISTVAIAVAPNVSVPGPKNLRTLPFPPETERIPASLQMISLVEAHPCRRPVSRTPTTCGHMSSQGIPAIASTASEPPTPMPGIPMPPALGV
ncbi:unnamed protein product [Alternaria burnsii]|nr:unnamed protein product [Alternaria burnsii]